MEWTSVKKGWVYQRKKHLLLPTSWSPKYVVLYSGPVPALAVYEQRSDAMPPYAPLLHLELTGGHVSVSTAHGSSNGGGFWASLSQSVASRRASITSALSRRGSFRDLNAAAASESEREKSKSYKERVLDEQGFMIHREPVDGQPGLKLCFATESREERDAWMAEISMIIDQANRKAVNAAANIFSKPQTSSGEAEFNREMQALAVRSPSNDLSIMCCGVKILDHRTVKQMLKRAKVNSGDDQQWDEESEDEEEIHTSQILESSNSRLSPNALIPDDLNLKYQQAIDEKRRADGDQRRRADLKLLKLSGLFSKSVSALVKKTIDSLHTTRAPLAQGTLHEDTLCRVQFVADYQAGCSEEEGCAWLRQEMLAARWINGQDSAPIHCMVMTEVDYKGFRAVGMLKLPVSQQTTLVFDVGSSEEDGIVSEGALMIMRELAKELHLLPSYPWRLADGRTIQMALHPNVQVHQIQSHTMAPNTGVMVVGRQAGKIQGGTTATTFTPAGYYLLNAGEIIPQLEDGEGVRTIRPELLQTKGLAVGAGTLHQDATSAAVQPLLQNAIAKLVKDLEEDLSVLPLDSAQWTQLIHSRGINIGLLGVLASKSSLPHVQEGLAIEMVARTLKRAVRSQLRQTVLHFREVQALLVEEELANIAVSAVNALLAPVSQGETGSKEWKQQLLGAVEANYGYSVGLERLAGLPRQALFLAVQHQCGFQFKSDAVLALQSENPLEPGHFIRFVPKNKHVYEVTAQSGEDEDDIRMTIAEKTLVSPGTGDISKASLAADFESLALSTREENMLRLARSTCPQTHARMASILLSEIELSASFDLQRATNIFTQATALIKAHLGEHHPYQLVIAERYTKILLLKADEDHEALWEALRVRQALLKDSAKILGKSHHSTKSQFKEIGDLQLKLGEWDSAIQSYREALKYQQGIEGQVQIRLKLADAFREKEDTEDALAEVQSCRKLIEKELPRRNSIPDSRQKLLKVQEDVLLRLAKLSQSVLQDERQDQMISAETEKHLLTAIECYEQLFETQRARAESNTEGEKLVELLQQITSLKLTLAPPAARAVIKLACRQQQQSPIEDKTMHELVVRLLSGPVAPSAFMDKLLEKAVSPDTMKDAESELKAVIQFSSSI